MGIDAPAATDALADILARFDRYHPSRIELTLDRVHRLLSDLGEPQRRLPPVVHVAGTNGKGSVIAFLRAICEAAGLAVSAYTSPHLVRFNERFLLAGRTIETDALCALLAEVDAANRDQPITEFEIVTAAAFLALSRMPADVVLLETGLGGRFDATNVIAAPLATVITPVGLDHEEFLSADLASIAGEKAAIQKAGVPSVVAPQAPAAAAVIDRVAAAVGAVPFRAGREWFIDPADGGFVLHAPAATLALPPPALRGAHQIVNAATAAACALCCTALGVAGEDIAAGVAGARWPGRLERLADGPLRRRLPADWEVWLDAGHNTEAGAALGAALREIDAAVPRPLHVVFGMLNDKDPGAFIAPLAALAQSVTATALPGEPRSFAAETCAAAAAGHGADVRTAASLAAAFDALAGAADRGRVLVCGSHIIVGAALRANEPTA